MLFLVNYWDGVVSGIISFAGFYLLALFPNYYSLSAILAVWTITTFLLIYRRFRQEEKITDLKRYLLAVLFSILGFTGVFLLLEWNILRWFIAVLASVCIGAIFVATDKLNLSRIAEYKPWRRMFMMLLVFDSYLILTTLFGVDVFFSEMISFWVLALSGSLIFSVSSLLIWQLYYEKGIKELLIWMILVALIIFELMWSAQFLPFGYLVLGLIITWLWYILQLFIRFRLSERGIIWEKQKFFLAGNFFLFLLFFYFIRWI